MPPLSWFSDYVRLLLYKYPCVHAFFFIVSRICRSKGNMTKHTKQRECVFCKETTPCAALHKKHLCNLTNLNKKRKTYQDLPTKLTRDQMLDEMEDELTDSDANASELEEV